MSKIITSAPTNSATNAFMSSGQQVVTEIQGLQSLEKSLYNHLVNMVTSNTGTSEEINAVTSQINEITNTRISLYETLYSMGVYYVSNLADTSISLQNQVLALEIVENELNEAKQVLASLEEQKVNKLRVIEIKKYYGEKYEEHTYVMSYVVGMFVWIFILSLLANRSILPDNIYYGLLVLVTVIYGFLIIRTILRIIKRDRMNYEEYDYGSMATPSPVTGNGSIPNTISPGMCMGQACCADNETYNPETNVCVPNLGVSPSPSPTRLTV